MRRSCVGPLGLLSCPIRAGGPSTRPAAQRVICGGKTHVDQPRQGRKKKAQHMFHLWQRRSRGKLGSSLRLCPFSSLVKARLQRCSYLTPSDEVQEHVCKFQGRHRHCGDKSHDGGHELLMGVDIMFRRRPKGVAFRAIRHEKK